MDGEESRAGFQLEGRALLVPGWECHPSPIPNPTPTPTPNQRVHLPIELTITIVNAKPEPKLKPESKMRSAALSRSIYEGQGGWHAHRRD